MKTVTLMPIHEYSCESCGNQFEKLLRRSTDAASLACPSCQSQKLRQEYSSFAAAVQGSTSRQPAMANGGGGCPAGMCGTPGLCGRN